MKIKGHPHIKIQGRKYTPSYTIISILSLGLFHIIKRHISSLNYIFTVPCKLEIANYILCLTDGKIYTVQKIILKKSSLALKRYIKNNEVRLLEVMHHRFLFDFTVNEYVKVGHCYGELDQLEKFILYGENVLNVKERKNSEIIFYRITDWVFIYELFCIVIWSLSDYTLYASIIFIINMFYLTIEIRKDIKGKMSPPKMNEICVIKNKPIKIKENRLFPGDMVILDVGDVVADIEIINGEVIVDESFLTGESIPLSRTRGNLIYAGTKILKSSGNGDIEKVKRGENIEKLRNIGLPVKSISRSSSMDNPKKSNSDYEVTKAIGIVKKTGFETYKGSLMREMLSCPESVYPFIEQYNTLIFSMFITFFILAIASFIYYEISTKKHIQSITYGIDMFLIAFSPTLFVSIKLGMVICDRRLKRHKIFVRDLNRLNGTGYVQTIVFDKTGTLTNEDLDILCIDELKYLRKRNSVIEKENLEFEDLKSQIADLNDKNELTNDYKNPVDEAEETANKLISVDKNIINNRDNRDNRESVDDVPLDDQSIATRSSEQQTICVSDSACYSEEEYKSSTSELELYEKVVEMQQSPDNNFSRMTKIGLSVCHTIMEVDGELLGDPLDLKMFEFSGSELKDRSVIVEEIGVFEIIKANEFTSSRRMMSVVVHGDRKYLFAKGSPEVIFEKVTNTPPHYQDIMNYYALEGFRVIAMAYKMIDSIEDESETNLIFLGFLVFSNQLKKVTKSVINDLLSANLKCKMATGDGILTAISVATQCGLINSEYPVIFPKMPNNARSLNDVDWMCLGDHDLYFDKVRLLLISEDDEIEENFAIACEGDLYEKIREESDLYRNFLLNKGVVFARMNPDQKKYLVEDLQKTNTTVCFCGDGANDCSALTAANVGISLNTEQQYFAGFTSKIKDIGCVIHVLREGRSSLIASISNFRLQFVISIIQFFSCFLLSLFFLFPSEVQTIHYDLFFVLFSSYVLSSFKTAPVLHNEEPKINILSKLFLIPLFGHLLIDFLFASGIFLFFRDTHFSQEFEKTSTQATVSFFITIVQGILALFFFTEGKPHRESKFKNLKFIFFIIVHLLFLILILIGTSYFESISNLYSFVWQSSFQRVFIVFYAILNALVLFIFHEYVDDVVSYLFSNKSKLQRKTERYEEFI
ncbi:putative cation-transporting ATPase [Dictyocoela muelleri]|nr:putative cation-transporting ATPase [Dictyocoela muelleri]